MSKCEKIAEGVTLYLGDCREILPTLTDIDAIVTDPPYGIDYRPEGGGKVPKTFTNEHRIIGDNAPFDPTALLGIAKEILLWGGNNFAHQLPASRGWLLWDKKAGLNPNSFSDAEVAWTNLDMPMRLITHRRSGYNKDSEIGIQREHPTQKPIVVMEWCLGFIKGTRILDPFMGSGTTGIAAVRAGRQFTGIEIEPRYFDVALRRINEEWRKPRMFADQEQPAEQLDWAEMWGKPFNKPELL